MSDIKLWDRVADGNQDPVPDGFPEGTQSPDSVNDCTREMMAAIRRQWEIKEWFDWGDVISYASINQINVSGAGSLIFRYTVGRRIALSIPAGTLTYATITEANAQGTLIGLSVDGDVPVPSDVNAAALGMAVTGGPVSVTSVNGLQEELVKAVPVGTILMYTSKTVPDRYLLCNGQSVGGSDFLDLFNVIGTLYGGSGLSNFSVPDFRGRSPVGEGTGSGLTQRNLGAYYGVENHTLTHLQAALPSHAHTSQYRYKQSLVPLSATGSYGVGGDALWRSEQIVVENTLTGFEGGPGFNASQSHPNVHPVMGIMMMIKY